MMQEALHDSCCSNNPFSTEWDKQQIYIKCCIVREKNNGHSVHVKVLSQTTAVCGSAGSRLRTAAKTHLYRGFKAGKRTH